MMLSRGGDKTNVETKIEATAAQLKLSTQSTSSPALDIGRDLCRRKTQMSYHVMYKTKIQKMGGTDA